MVDIEKKFVRKIISPAGDRMQQLYKAVLQDDGTFDLVPDGVENLYEKIQSYKESCLVENILKRYQNGETDVLNQVQGFYGDYNDFPDSPRAALQMVLDGQSLFENLPPDQKDKFDNDFNKFFVSIGSPEWFEKLGVVAEKKEEVKEDVGE